MICANCGLEIYKRPSSAYGETYRHVTLFNGIGRATCVYANSGRDKKKDIDWSTKGKYCNEEGYPYLASLTKGEVTKLRPQDFDFPKVIVNPNLAPWDRK